MESSRRILGGSGLTVVLFLEIFAIENWRLGPETENENENEVISVEDDSDDDDDGDIPASLPASVRQSLNSSQAGQTY